MKEFLDWVMDNKREIVRKYNHDNNTNIKRAGDISIDYIEALYKDIINTDTNSKPIEKELTDNELKELFVYGYLRVNDGLILTIDKDNKFIKQFKANMEAMLELGY